MSGPILKAAAYRPTVSVGNQTNTVSGAMTVATGIYRFSVAAGKDACHVVLGANPDASAGGLHVAAGESILVKHEAPRRELITAATAANPIVATLAREGGVHNEFRVGDAVTVSGAAVGDYNVTHATVSAVTPSTISLNVDGSSFAAFTGTAEVRNSVKYAVYPDGSNGSDVHCTEVSAMVA